MFKKLLIAGLLTAAAIQSVPVQAGPPGYHGGPGPGWHGPGPGYHRGPGPGWHGPGYGPGPRWYGWGPGGRAMFWTGFGLECGALALGALVTYLPPERTVVYYGGAPYYSYGGTYFQATPGGYVVVNPPPVVVAQPAPVTYVVQQPAPVTYVVQQPQTVVVQQQPNVIYVK